MTESESYLRDLESAAGAVGAIPNDYADLRQLLATLPPGTAPDLRAGRTGITAQAAGAGGLDATGLTIQSNVPIGTESGAGLGRIAELFYGKANFLPDPTFERVNDNPPGNIGLAFGSSLGEEYETDYDLISGTAPTTRIWKSITSRESAQTNVNSNFAQIDLSGFASGTTEYKVRSINGANALAAPYVIAAIRVPCPSVSPVLTNITSITIWTEIVDASSGATLAQSTPFDWIAFEATHDHGESTRVWVAYAGTEATKFQIRVRVVATGAGAGFTLLFAEPQLVWSSTQEPPPFAPIVAAWSPRTVKHFGSQTFPALTSQVLVTRRYGDAGDRFSIRNDGRIGWELAATDVSFEVNAAKVLTLASASGAQGASLEFIVQAAPSTPAANRGRLYYSSADKHFHQIDDAGLDTDLAAGGGGGLPGGTPALTYGTANAAGAAAFAIRTDATIDIFDVTAPSQLTSKTAAVGVVAKAARRDHKHSAQITLDDGATSDYVTRARLAADTTYRVVTGLDASDRGSIEFGAGGVAARDLQVFRAAAGQLEVNSLAAAASTNLTVRSTAGQSPLISLLVAGDASTRLLVNGSAAMTGLEMGSGSGGRDIRWQRNAAGRAVYDTNGSANTAAFVVESTAGSLNVIQAQVAGDTNGRVQIRGDASEAGIKWGSGSATQDLRMRRSAALTLLVDDNAGGNLTLVNFLTASLQRAGVEVELVTGATAGPDANITIDAAGAAGTASTHARSQHGHQLVTSAAAPVVVDATAAAAGTSGTAPSRGDHRHNLGAHGAASHTNITRRLWLNGELATLDGATFALIGASPDQTRVVAYANAATSGATWNFNIPDDWDSGVITAQPVWSPGSTDAVAHTVRWSYVAKTNGAGATITAAGTTTTWTGASAARTVGVLVYDTATSTTITPGVNDTFRLEVRRIGGDAADTYVGVVNLVGIIITYTANE